MSARVKLDASISNLKSEAVVVSTGLRDPKLIEEVITLTGASLIDKIAEIPAIHNVPGAWEQIVLAGQLAFADAYKWVYYVSIGRAVVQHLAHGS